MLLLVNAINDVSVGPSTDALGIPRAGATTKKKAPNDRHEQDSLIPVRSVKQSGYSTYNLRLNEVRLSWIKK